MKKRIGLVGVGLMGSGMARNLLSSGFSVLAYDMDPAKIDAIVSSGAERAQSPDEIPPRVDVVMASLPNSHVVEDVIRHSLRLFETGREGLIFIDTTTADPILSEKQAAALSEKGIDMLDATLGGTSAMCARKEIAVMVGGKEGVFESCRDIFSSIAKDIFYIGKNGSGAMMKLIHNLVLGLNRMALAEGLTLGRKAGMDPGRVLEVLRQSPAYSMAMDMKGTRMVEGNYLPAEGKLGFHLKDVRYILDVGARLNFPLPLSSLHAQALASQVAKGHGEWDNAAIAAFYSDLAGLE